MEVTYSAYRLNGDGTETLLDPDLWLHDAKITREMNGIGRLTGKVPPEHLLLRNHNNHLVWQAWRTCVYVEVDGQLFDAFIVSDIIDGPAHAEIDCVGFLGYWSGQPYEKEFNQGNVPATTVINAMINDLQSVRQSNVGVVPQFVGGGFPRLGNPLPVELPAIPDLLPKPAKFTEKQPTSPTYPSDPTKQNLDAYRQAQKTYDAALKAWRTRHDAADKKQREYEDRVRERQDAIKQRNRVVEDSKVKLNPWSTQDLLREFQALSGEIGMSYKMRHGFGSHRLVCSMGLPGRRRTDLDFLEGENVYAIPKHERPGSDVATVVRVLGHGEGRDMKKAYSSSVLSTNGPLRRVRTVVDKTLYRSEQLQSKANRILKYYQSPLVIEPLKIIDHDLAAFGDFDVGDEIKYHPTARRAGNGSPRWVTITSISLDVQKGEFVVTVTPSEGVLE